MCRVADNRNNGFSRFYLRFGNPVQFVQQARQIGVRMYRKRNGHFACRDDIDAYAVFKEHVKNMRQKTGSAEHARRNDVDERAVFYRGKGAHG